MPIKYDDKGMVKRPDDEYGATRDQIVDAAKCMTSVKYFAENYYWIINPKHGEMKIELRDYQERMLNNMEDNRFNILLAARQVGKCLNFDQYVEILDTETGEIEQIQIGDLFEMI